MPNRAKKKKQNVNKTTILTKVIKWFQIKLSMMTGCATLKHLALALSVYVFVCRYVLIIFFESFVALTHNNNNNGHYEQRATHIESINIISTIYLARVFSDRWTLWTHTHTHTRSWVAHDLQIRYERKSRVHSRDSLSRTLYFISNTINLSPCIAFLTPPKEHLTLGAHSTTTSKSINQKKNERVKERNDGGMQSTIKSQKIWCSAIHAIRCKSLQYSDDGVGGGCGGGMSG